MVLPASPRERIVSLNDLPLQDPQRSERTSVNGKARRVPEEDDDGKDSAKYGTEFAVPDASSEREVARLKHQLSATLAAQTKRDQRLAQLTDELTLKSALLEQAEANAVEATQRLGLELREHADRLSEREQQLSVTLARRDQRLAQLTDELHEQADQLLAQTSLVEQKDTKLVRMQAKLDELQLSRDQQVRALVQAQISLQKPTSRAADDDERGQRACEQIEQYETELAEVRAELEARKSELEEVRLRLTEAEHGWAKSKIEADTLRSLTMASLISPDEDRVARGLVERIRSMEAEMASLRWNEKGSDTPTSNEG